MIWTERMFDEASEQLMRDPKLGYESGEAIPRRPMVDLYGHSIAIDAIEHSGDEPDWITGVRLKRVGAPSYCWTFRTGTWSQRVAVREALVALAKLLVPEEVTYEAPDAETKRSGGATSRPDRQRRDEVDEASWESFPASDPPAFY